MDTESRQIAIISDQRSVLQILEKSLSDFGYDVGVSCSPEHITLTEATANPIDAWLIYLSDEDKWADFIDEIINSSDAPILFGDPEIPSPQSTDFMRWQRNLLEKSSKLIGAPGTSAQTSSTLNEAVKIQQQKPLPALPSITASTKAIPTNTREQDKFNTVSRIWVLGASLGGPAAVKEFLDTIPGSLPVAFILAQHIDKGFQKVLSQVLGRHSAFDVSKTILDERIEYGKVYIAPVETMMAYQGGKIISTGETWRAPYAPCIDQVMQITHDCYGHNCGVILFSGMGNDGAVSAPIITSGGSTLWAQNAESCANSSMPDAARQTGCVSLSGTPKQLALQLIARINKETSPDKTGSPFTES